MGPPGRWVTLAPLPLPRSEMCWATAWAGRVHLIGGYGLMQVNRPYHHAYDPAQDRWLDLAPLPLGANHVGVEAMDGVIYALGGHIDQNRRPHRECFAYDVADNRWRAIAPLSRARGAAGVAGIGGKIHILGGAIGDTIPTKASIPWHEVYDPRTDRWEARADMPGFPLDHKGVVVMDDRIHVIGGRINSFATNVAHHRVYFPESDKWEDRRPMPSPRSGHGAAVMGGRIWCMGGEETGKVFGQMESYDPATDTWQQHAPMPTPRHGLGAAAVGNWVYVAGGGPVVGGSTQSSLNEAFTLG
jgi:N-acetylneuraminic acid mutarotase